MSTQDFFNSIFPATTLTKGEILLGFMNQAAEEHDEWVKECERKDLQYLASLN